MSMFEPMYSNNENDLYYVYYIKLYLNSIKIRLYNKIIS
jgi:hypothetical protein